MLGPTSSVSYDQALRAGRARARTGPRRLVADALGVGEGELVPVARPRPGRAGAAGRGRCSGSISSVQTSTTSASKPPASFAAAALLESKLAVFRSRSGFGLAERIEDLVGDRCRRRRRRSASRSRAPSGPSAAARPSRVPAEPPQPQGTPRRGRPPARRSAPGSRRAHGAAPRSVATTRLWRVGPARA